MIKRCYCCADEVKNGLYGLHEDCYTKWFLSKKLFENIDPKTSNDSSKRNSMKKDKNSFYHGKYLKYSARCNGISYILKVQEDDHPDLPAMEYLCNKIASILSLDTAHYYMIDFKNRPTFVTKNFMQDCSGSLHHMYKFLPENMDYSCAEIIKIIGNRTKRPRDICRFMERCLFDCLIGNNDRHGRNLGIIETSSGIYLAPMYDNPSYFGIVSEDLLGADFNISGHIRTKAEKKPKILDYLMEFRKMNYQKTCNNFIKKTVNRFGLIVEEVKKSYISDKRKKYFLAYLEKRVNEIENEI
ncbi:MAG: HipA domain-containing protein [Halobacteriovoraceae bacterium]|nr:HipA domain-containing protein [Halobacteriovoraceae bacterium]